MRQRRYLFPHVIEMNYQAGRRLGVNVYLIDGGSEFLLIDIGYLDTVEEIIDLIRRMDFNLSTCKMVIATHADADHIQGLARAKELLKTAAAAHPLTVEPIIPLEVSRHAPAPLPLPQRHRDELPGRPAAGSERLSHRRR